ncbi:flavin reductase family protein [Oryzibacter oryziterrae]|uniref:flavin reductase family protein n=1 Tax=Oryzibacter oryziterrae TaxID=2766474 RepID=UPI001F182E49|nr:flavin reductase family protein [Oryzibacter oryziterrae]
MFYRVSEGHGLPHDPFQALVVPRPIGWISTVSAEGIANLAPYSFFNALGTHPHVVGFSAGPNKDSQRNAEATGCFTVNLVTADLSAAMNETSAPVSPEVDEFGLAGLTAVAGTAVACPRVGEAKAALECVYLQTVPIVGRDGGVPDNFLVLGEVVAIHIDEAILTDGYVDLAKAPVLTRLGYKDYAVVRDSFTMLRPHERTEAGS